MQPEVIRVAARVSPWDAELVFGRYWACPPVR
jgi:hypothetical protein